MKPFEMFKKFNEKPSLASPEIQFMDTIERVLGTAPDEIILDGEMHRFWVSGKPSDKTGWYRGYADNIPAGSFGDWKQNINEKWRADTDAMSDETPMDAAARLVAIEENRKVRELEKLRKQQITAANSLEIWNNSNDASDDYPYLLAKKIKAHGAKIGPDGRLITPLYNIDQTLTSLQRIGPNGSKQYEEGGKCAESFCCIPLLGETEPAEVLYFVEGFATGATVHEQTGFPVIVCYTASNLAKMVGIFREKMPGQKFIVVGDNDASGTGQKAANECLNFKNTEVIIIPTKGQDANDFFLAGGDLHALLMPKLTSDWLIPASELIKQPSPLKWLIKGLLQAETLHMFYGPPESYKSFLMLDWSLYISSGLGAWNGRKVNQGAVIYLAGEGVYGMRARIKAWMKYYGVGDAGEFWASSDGCDLNTKDGKNKIIENIRKLGIKPALIVVDTLHRFFAGDENSSMDAKTLIDACEELMREFGCAVVLVHHTGAAGGRARGSTAFLGSMGIELKVERGTKEGEPVKISQTKNKDAPKIKPIHLMFQKVTLDDWPDDEGLPSESGVMIETEEPEVEAERPSSLLAGFRRTFEQAWWATGAELIDGKPYVSRSGMKDYLVTNQAIKPSTADQQLKPGMPDKLIGMLLGAEVIAVESHGWVVIDGVMAMLMRKKKQEG